MGVAVAVGGAWVGDAVACCPVGVAVAVGCGVWFAGVIDGNGGMPVFGLDGVGVEGPAVEPVVGVAVAAGLLSLGVGVFAWAV